jgi:hypothetical protein
MLDSRPGMRMWRVSGQAAVGFGAGRNMSGGVKHGKRFLVTVPLL